MGVACISGTFDRDTRDIGAFQCPASAHLDRDNGTGTYPSIGYVPMSLSRWVDIEEFNDVPPHYQRGTV